MGKTKILKKHGESFLKQKNELRLEDFEGVKQVNRFRANFRL